MRNLQLGNVNVGLELARTYTKALGPSLDPYHTWDTAWGEEFGLEGTVHLYAHCFSRRYWR
jgi:hypothetical protein